MKLPTYAMVLAAVEEHMSKATNGWDHLWTVRWQVARQLDGLAPDDSMPTRISGQVYRALQALVADGKLVRTGGGPGSDPSYYTPAGWQKHEKDAESARVVRAGLDQRRADVTRRLSVIGFDIERMALADWECLADLLEARP